MKTRTPSDFLIGMLTDPETLENQLRNEETDQRRFQAACAAMQGLAAAPGTNEWGSEKTIRVAVEYADALLAELEKK